MLELLFTIPPYEDLSNMEEKQLLIAAMMKNRYIWAQKYVSWTVEEKRVVL